MFSIPRVLLGVLSVALLALTIATLVFQTQTLNFAHQHQHQRLPLDVYEGMTYRIRYIEWSVINKTTVQLAMASSSVLLISALATLVVISLPNHMITKNKSEYLHPYYLVGSFVSIGFILSCAATSWQFSRFDRSPGASDMQDDIDNTSEFGRVDFSGRYELGAWYCAFSQLSVDDGIQEMFRDACKTADSGRWLFVPTDVVTFLLYVGLFWQCHRMVKQWRKEQAKNRVRKSRRSQTPA